MSRILTDYRAIRDKFIMRLLVADTPSVLRTRSPLMNILHLDSSILADASASRSLTRDIVATLVRTQPDANVVGRDLAASVSGHFDGALLAARSTPPELRSAEA